MGWNGYASRQTRCSGQIEGCLERQQSCLEQQQSGLVSGLNNTLKIVTHQKKGAKKSVDKV